ncbi:MAG: carboxypeptidase regulatory-like domain-containing protein [Gemmatimonadaceae bacterium]
MIVCTLPALAQTARPGGSVSGTIYDSVARAPLAGAIVQAALIDPSRSSTRGDSGLRVFTAVADAEGKYRVGGLPAGRYGIGFQHSSLSAVGLEPPLRAFELSADASIVIDLAIPPGPQVRALKCSGTSGDEHDGMLAGFVRDAAQGNTLAGATVAVSWVEIAVVDGKLRTVPRRTVATAGDEGTFLACGLASETALAIEITNPGYRAISGEITVPDGGAMRHDFRLADSAAVRGSSTVSGRVVHADGSPAASGRASIGALGLDVPMENGVFSISAVPAGTWLVEARVIGYEPESGFADVAEGAPANVWISLKQKVQILDAITVVGKLSGDLKALSDISERRRTSFGSYFLPGNSWLTSATYPTDVVRAARGFTYLSIDNVRARGCTGLGAKGKSLAVYIDGTRFPAGLEDLNTAVTMKDILAIETYPDIVSAPMLWRTNDACAVIAVWTRR